MYREEVAYTSRKNAYGRQSCYFSMILFNVYTQKGLEEVNDKLEWRVDVNIYV